MGQPSLVLEIIHIIRHLRIRLAAASRLMLFAAGASRNHIRGSTAPRCRNPDFHFCPILAAAPRGIDTAIAEVLLSVPEARVLPGPGRTLRPLEARTAFEGAEIKGVAGSLAGSLHAESYDCLTLATHICSHFLYLKAW